MTGDCYDCFEQLDEINAVFEKAVDTYGVDSVMFYKINGTSFGDQFSVHKYPTVVYLDPAIDTPNKAAKKRLIGPLVTPNSFDHFVMECVELAPDQIELTHYVPDDREPGKDLDPQVLSNDLDAAMEYIGMLKEALTDSYIENAQQGEHHYEYLEDDELVM